MRSYRRRGRASLRDRWPLRFARPPVPSVRFAHSCAAERNNVVSTMPHPVRVSVSKVRQAAQIAVAGILGFDVVAAFSWLLLSLWGSSFALTEHQSSLDAIPSFFFLATPGLVLASAIGFGAFIGLRRLGVTWSRARWRNLLWVSAAVGVGWPLLGPAGLALPLVATLWWIRAVVQPGPGS